MKSKTIDTFINLKKAKLKKKTQNKDILLKGIMNMFVLEKYDTRQKPVLRKQIVTVIKFILKHDQNKKQFYLSKLSDKYNSLKDGSDLKNDTLFIFKKLVDSYMNESIDISCLLNKSNCGSNNIKGTCGTIMNKMKMYMSMKEDLTKYKDFVKNLKESLNIL